MTRNGCILMISFKLYENFLAWKPCKQRHIPGGWFFAVFELNGHSSCTNRIEMPVIKSLGEKPIETPSSTHFQTRSQGLGKKNLKKV